MSLAIVLALVADSRAAEPGWREPVALPPSVGLDSDAVSMTRSQDSAGIAWSSSYTAPDLNLVEVEDATGRSQTRQLVAPFQPVLVHEGLPFDFADSRDGRSTLAWSTDQGVGWAFKPAGAAFGGISALKVGRPGFTDISMDRDGNTVMVVKGWHGHLHNEYRLWVMYRPAGGEFGAPVPGPLLDSPGPVKGLLLPAGRVVLNWIEDNVRVMSSSGTTSGGFSNPSVLSTGDVDVSARHRLAGDAQGGVVAAWREEAGPDGVQRIMATTQLPVGSFRVPQAVGISGRYEPLDLGVDDSGRVLLSSISPSNGALWGVTGSTLTGLFSDPATIAHTSRGHTAVAPDGGTLAVWDLPGGGVASQFSNAAGQLPVRKIACEGGGRSVQSVLLGDDFDAALLTSDLHRYPGYELWTSAGAIAPQGRPCHGPTEPRPAPAGTKAAPAEKQGPRRRFRSSTMNFVGRISRVPEGDTVIVQAASGSRFHVRLLAIDAPRAAERPECGGRGARMSMRRLAPPGRRVRVSGYAIQGRRYDATRLLAYVANRDGRQLNVIQVRRGWARVRAHHVQQPKIASTFGRAARQARRQGRGIWHRCGGDFHRQGRG